MKMILLRLEKELSLFKAKKKNLGEQLGKSNLKKWKNQVLSIKQQIG